MSLTEEPLPSGASPIESEDGDSGSSSLINPHTEMHADLVVVHEAAKLIGNSATPDDAIAGILRLMSELLGELCICLRFLAELWT